MNEILREANNAKFMTLTTLAEDGRPQSTTVEFCVWGDRVVFDTFKNTRKFNNLERDSRVSMVMMPHGDASVDFEGTAKLLEREDLAQAKNVYFEKIPEAVKWGDREDIAYFAVSILWARLTDVSISPWVVTEKRI